jgi:hypothetical protein
MLGIHLPETGGEVYHAGAVVVNAHVLMGEASTCSMTAMVAIAWMISRGAGPWYGWHPEPNSGALFAASYYWTQPDPTPWARFVFSAEDMELARVKAIVGKRKPLAIFQCDAGLALYFF